MSTKASRKIARLVLAAAVCSATASVAPHAQSTPRSTSPSRKLSRSEHLRDWLAAIERHTPGTIDDATHVLDSWRADDFQYLAIDVKTLLAVMTDPGARTFFVRPDGRGRWMQQVYGGSDLKLIVELAMAARARGAAPRSHVTLDGVEAGSFVSEEQLQKNKNHILKRGAIFHTDVALDSFDGHRSKGQSVPAGLQEFTLPMPDGRPLPLTVDVGHWELARSLLDNVVPAAARDAFVSRWYSATGAYLQGLGQLTPSHFSRGLNLFPEDGELLFQAACLHESIAEPRVQDAIQSAAVPSDVRFDISSRRAELRDAERLFRKALKAQPDHVEARIRLGRVLGLRDEHAEAETLLRRAVADAKEPLLQYYAQLFLGAEREALGDRGQARDLYVSAALLYPDAQSPRLALSLLSARDGNQKDALGAMSAVLSLPGDTRVDPWWNYHSAQGRNAIADLTALYDRFLDEDRR
jgi:tetratricopeptide (TPR) repeat protein